MTRMMARPDGTTAIARPRTFLHLIVDASSSMGVVQDRTRAAVNEFLDSQRHARVDELFVSLSTFDTTVKTVYVGLPIEEAPPLTPNTYRPKGMTALYDGIHAGIVETDKVAGQGDRALIVVVTDGDDTASRELHAADLRAIVQRYRRRGNWTFVFLAANLDAQAEADRIGFPGGNVDSYVVTDEGVHTAIMRVDDKLKAYRSTDDLQTDRFYSPAKRWKRPQWASSPNVVLTDDE